MILNFYFNLREEILADQRIKQLRRIWREFILEEGRIMNLFRELEKAKSFSYGITTERNKTAET